MLLAIENVMNWKHSTLYIYVTKLLKIKYGTNSVFFFERIALQFFFKCEIGTADEYSQWNGTDWV